MRVVSDDRHPPLYGITAGGVSASADAADLLATLDSAFAAGLRWVQLREKDLPSGELAELAAEVVAIARRRRAKVIVNDRADIAHAVGADGVQLTESSLDVATVRRAFPDLIIGASAHGLDRARRVADAGADFVVLGPVFETPSKRAYGAPLGLAQLTAVAGCIAVPIVAVGGIGPEQVGACLSAGARGVAAIRQLIGSADPGVAVRRYLAALAAR